MTDTLIDGLLAKRTEVSTQLLSLQSNLYHLNATLELLGHKPDEHKRQRFFANGELIRLIGDAERSGLTSSESITQQVMKSKGFDYKDGDMRKVMLAKAKECRKRTAR